MSTKSSKDMNAGDILAEMSRLLARYRAGLIEEKALREELSILQAMQKAYDTVILEERISRLEGVIGGRNGHR